MSNARPATDRQQRRQAQSQADRAKAPQRTPKPTKRLWLVVLAAAVVIGAVVGILLATRSSSPPTGGTSISSGPISVHTVASVPAASAAVQGDGGAWVTDDLRNLVIRFDPATGKTESTLHLAGRPVAMVLDHGDLWVASMITNTVDEISTAPLRLLKSVSVPNGPSGLAVLAGRIWVTSVIGNTLTPIDATTATAGSPITLSAGAVRVAAGFGALWITGTSNEVTEVQPAADKVQTKTYPIATGSGPIGVATGAGSVWVADAVGGTVVQIDPKTRRVIRTYKTGGDPLALAVAGGRVWLADGMSDHLQVLYPANEINPATLSGTPRSLVADGAGVWVALANPGRIAAATVG